MDQETLCDPDETAPAIPDGACINYADCGNMTHGGTESANEICDECLSTARENDLRAWKNEQNSYE
jgi:hypothetical protein